MWDRRREEKLWMPQCWKTQGSECTARPVWGPRSTCLGRRRTPSCASVQAEQVAPCTRTLLRRDRVAVAVVCDDVLKRLVHAQEHARLYSFVLFRRKKAVEFKESVNRASPQVSDSSRERIPQQVPDTTCGPSLATGWPRPACSPTVGSLQHNPLRLASFRDCSDCFTLHFLMSRELNNDRYKEETGPTQETKYHLQQQ